MKSNVVDCSLWDWIYDGDYHDIWHKVNSKALLNHAFYELQQQNSKIVANSLFDHYLFILAIFYFIWNVFFEIFALCLLCTVFYFSQGIVDNGMIWLTIKPIKTCISNELCVCTDHSHTKIITTKLHILLTNTSKAHSSALHIFFFTVCFAFTLVDGALSHTCWFRMLAAQCNAKTDEKCNNNKSRANVHGLEQLKNAVYSDRRMVLSLYGVHAYRILR